MKENILHEIRDMVKGRVAVNEIMSRHTTLGIGGPAEIFVEPLDLPDLRRLAVWALSRGVDTRIVGSGSNILVPDGGIRGITIVLSSPCFRHIETGGENLHCGAGTKIADLVKYGVERGWGGLEFLVSIPGTVGGAVAMNAGAWGRDMAGIIKEATVVDAQGSISTIDRDGLAFGYRRCELPRGSIIVSATFCVKARPVEEVGREVDMYAVERERRFPAGPSAGSIFKNPGGDHAGRLIEAAGLKGKICGRARISTVHANFIVNLGGASGSDVLRLIEMARETVREMFGIELETEIDIFNGV